MNDTQLELTPRESAELGHVPASPLSIMLAQGANLNEINAANLEKLLALHERMEDRQAQRSLANALAAFQQDVPPIAKNRSIMRKSGPPTPYAGFEDVQKVVRPVLAKHGLSVSFDTRSENPETLTAVCTVRHREGASISSEFTVKIDHQLSANITQQHGSALTYAKRYALCAALNLTVGDSDDDGGAAGGTSHGVETLNPGQVKRIENLLSQLPFPQEESEDLLKWAGVSTIAEIPESKFTKAVNGLNDRIAKARR